MPRKEITRDKIIAVRVTDAEYNEIKDAALQRHVPISKIVRSRVASDGFADQLATAG